MSQMRFCYDDMIIDSTVITYNSENESFPVENIGNEILGKKYRTETGFIIKTGYNDVFQFYEGRTGSSTVISFALSATTFTGAGLAAAVQTGMRANGKFSAQTVSYSTSTERFTTTKSATATSMSLRFDNLDMSACEIMGYIKKDHASASTFISSPTKGNQQWVELQKDNLSGSVFILDNHNFSSGTVLKLRAQSTSTYFYGLNQYGYGDGIFQEFTNLVQDPTDLTTGNWTNNNSVDELSTLSINGNYFTKVINDGDVTGRMRQDITGTWTTLTPIFFITMKKGNTTNNTTKLAVYNNMGGHDEIAITIDWDNYSSSPGIPSSGTLLDYDWIDSETLQMYIKCDSLSALTDDLVLLLYASDTALDGEYTYYTEVQIVDSATMFPFVDGTHTADVINETFTMPDKFAIDVIFEPKFAYDNGSFMTFMRWALSSSQEFSIGWQGSNHKIYVQWNDNTADTYMFSEAFDDGTLLTNINQRLRLVLFMDLTTGTTEGSRFIVIPLESVGIMQDDLWTGNSDIKNSNFETLNIGYNGTGSQANSDIESLRIYGWDGVKPTITSSADADNYFADETKLLNLDYKHTTYMKYLATSTTNGQFEQEITVNEDPCVTLLDETLQGNVLQMSWADIKNSYSEIGRAFLSPVFYPANHPDNKISWFKRKILRRSRQTMAYSGATYFDKRDPVNQYTLIPDPLNEYWNPTTKTDMETFLDTVADYNCFYVILDSDLSNTVYGFLPGNTDYNRLKNTPTIIIPPLLLQEQK